MRFPTPEVAGVFLKLPQRVAGAITSGEAARYLIGDGLAERLRNNVGFHGAIAEFVDALLERAVLPYQTTTSLSSLAVLPDADLPGHDSPPPGESPPPELYAPVPFDSVISTAEKRARLGREKRFAPLEFWKAMFRGSDALARVAAPSDLSNGSGALLVYPSVLYPRQGEVWHYDWWEHAVYGFNDLVDTGWCGTTDFPTAWMPPDPAYSWHMESFSNLGRVALEVSSTLVGFYDGWPDSSLPMVAGLAGFDVPWWPWTTSSVAIHGGFQFAGRVATFMHFDWNRHPEGPSIEVTLSPYYADFAGDIEPLMVSSLAVAKAYNGLDGRYPAGHPWISPFDVYRSLATTPRANLDVLRIQQLLLGLFWANWARMSVAIEVPHVEETVRRTWHVDEYGNVRAPYDTPVSSKTCSELSVDQECQWRLSLNPDLEYSRHYECSNTLYYVIPFWRHTNEMHESAVESYPYLDGLDADGVGLGAAEVRRIVEEAKRKKQQAEQDKAAAEADLAAAEQQLASSSSTFASAFAGTADIDRWTDGSRSFARLNPGTTWIYYECYFTIEVSSGSSTSGYPGYGYRAPDPDDDSVPGAFLAQDTANYLYNTFLLSSYVVHGDVADRLVSRDDVVTIHRNGIVITVPSSVVAGLWDRREARKALADAEARIAEVSDTAEFGVKVDIGPELFRRLLSRNDGLLYNVIYGDCDEDSANLLDEGMAWMTTHGGDMSGWKPADPRGGYDYAETAYRRVPALDIENCPVRVYLARLFVEGVSPWPAASVLDAGYVQVETVALGMTMLDEARGYYSGQDGIESDFDDDDPEPFYRRVAMSGAPGPGVSAPAETIRGILAALVDQHSPDLPPRAASAVGNGRFDSLLFAEPNIAAGGAPNFRWDPAAPVYAWYHPDRGPDMASSYHWLNPGKMWPYRVTGVSPDGLGSVTVCSLENGDRELYCLAVTVGLDWYSLIITPADGFHDQMTLHLGEHVAVRAVWNWKSMPVEQE